MTAPSTAGGYIALRRQAAGLSRIQAAKLYAYSALGHAAAEQLLAEIEGNDVVVGDAVLARLQGVFRFSASIYQQMAQGYPPPSLCHDCGCSWQDPCDDADGSGGRGCAWVDAAATECTACRRRKQAEAA